MVRIGVVGAGLVAHAVHLPLLRELDDRFDVVAVADPRPESRADAARRFGVPHAYADHRELLAAGALDAVLICSPNGTHAGAVLDALDAGVHVLVEKPLCLTLADADRIVAARDRTGLTVQVGYMKRFDPAYEALLADLPASVAIRHVATTTYDPELSRHFGGSGAGDGDPFSDAFLGALIHDVNAVHGVLERAGVALPLDVVDGGCAANGRTATGVVALPGGARWTLAWLLLPGAGEFREEVAVYAEDAIRTLVFPAPYVLRAPAVYRCGAGGVRRSFRSWEEAYARQLLHFHACVSEGRACRTPPEQARADIELLTRIFAAVR
jgi:predicted dehydrogenase